MGLLVFGLVIAIGAALTYGGYSIYGFAVFILGAVMSAGGYYIFTTTSQASAPSIVSILSVGFVGGIIFSIFHILAIIAGGFVVGWLAVGLLGVPSDLLQAVGGLVGAGLSLFLYGIVLIISTAAIGALLVSKAITAGPTADLLAILLTKESNAVFWIVFATGSLFQFATLSADDDERSAGLSKESK